MFLIQGIGFVSAMEFAKRGARVVMACRNLEKGNEARQKIVQETDNENVIVKRLDLASFNSVREFAEDVNSSEERVDVLLNNAGVGVSERITEDGFKEAVQVNYLSAFLLTTLLIGESSLQNIDNWILLQFSANFLNRCYILSPILIHI